MILAVVFDIVKDCSPRR